MPTTLRNTDILFNDNTTQATASDYAVQAFTSPGTWTKPATVKRVKVTVVGGGGGGTGKPSPATSIGNGGGGSALACNVFPGPSIPGPVSVTIGAGGVGDTLTNPGGDGGTSSFGSFISATGGGGGIYNSAGGAGGVAAGSLLPFVGGKGSAGDPPAAGGSGGTIFSDGVTSTATTVPRSTGAGDGTPFFRSQSGAGGRNNTFNANPDKNASGFGAGGGGVGGSSPQGALTGGDGSPGIVIIEEFY